MHGAGGRHLDGVGQFTQEPLADLARSPVGLLAFGCNNRGFYLLGQLVGITKRPSCPVGQTIQTTLLIPFADLVTGLARNPELAAQRSHTLSVLQTDHKTHPFVHNRTLLPRHGFIPLWGVKFNPCLRNVLLPMSQAGHYTGRRDRGALARI